MTAQEIPGTLPPVERLVSYVLSFLHDDGSFRSDAGSASDLGTFLTPLAIQALSAGHLDPRETRAGPASASPMEWLHDHFLLFDASKATDWEKQILAIAAGYHDPRDFQGIDYAHRLRDLHVNGQMGNPQYLNDDMFGILALRASNFPPEDAVVESLREYVVREQNVDGSWGASPGSPGDVDMTALGLAAVVAGGLDPQSPDAGAARDWLRGRQVASGGFATAGSKANLQSTAWAVWGLRSAGEDLEGANWSRSAGATPIAWLASRVGPEGSVVDSSGNERGLWEALDVLLALSGTRYPVAAYLEPASLADPRDVRAGVPVTFQPPAGSHAYRWDFGDGSAAEEARCDHVFARAGSYAVNLTWWSGDYGKSLQSFHVVVAPSPPAPWLTMQMGGAGPGSVSLRADASSDPDGEVVAYRWSLGDGTDLDWGAPSRLVHTYIRSGAFTIRLEVRDNDDLVGATEASLTVAVPSPWSATVTAQPPNPVMGQPVELSARVNPLPPGGVEVAWKLPDGSTTTGSPVEVTFDVAGPQTIHYVIAEPSGNDLTGTLEVLVREAPTAASIHSQLPSVHRPVPQGAPELGGAVALAVLFCVGQGVRRLHRP